jgi:hypothetical protein
MHRRVDGLCFEVPSPSLYILDSPTFLDCYIVYGGLPDRDWILNVRGRNGWYQIGFVSLHHAVGWIRGKVNELHLEIDAGGRVVIDGGDNDGGPLSA